MAASSCTHVHDDARMMGEPLTDSQARQPNKTDLCNELVTCSTNAGSASIISLLLLLLLLLLPGGGGLAAAASSVLLGALLR